MADLSADIIRRISQLEQRQDDLIKPEVVIDLVSPFLALPGLRGYWPMSSSDSGGTAEDLSGQGHDLTNNNNATLGYDNLAPYFDYDGANQYHSRATEADLDLLGTEADVGAAFRGIFLIGWFQFDDDPPAADEFLIAKRTAGAANQSYSLLRRAATTFRFTISDGAATDSVTTTATTTSGQWYMGASVFIPSTEISLYLMSSDIAEKATNNAGIPAAINNSAVDFTIGAGAAPGNYLDGRASDCAIGVTRLSDAIVESVFESTRGGYGV